MVIELVKEWPVEKGGLPLSKVSSCWRNRQLLAAPSPPLPPVGLSLMLKRAGSTAHIDVAEIAGVLRAQCLSVDMLSMDGKICNIENLGASGKYLNVTKNSVMNGAQIQLWDNRESRSTQWQMHAAGKPGTYTLEGVCAGGKYLDVNGVPSNGANLHIWGAQDPGPTKWHFQSVGNCGICVIECVKHTGKFVSAAGTSIACGTKVHISDDPESLRSLWRVQVKSLPVVDSAVKPYINGNITVTKLIYERKELVAVRCTHERDPLAQSSASRMSLLLNCNPKDMTISRICAPVPDLFAGEQYTLAVIAGVQAIGIGSNIERRTRACRLAAALQVALSNPTVINTPAMVADVPFIELLAATRDSIMSSHTHMQSPSASSQIFATNAGCSSIPVEQAL